MPKEDLPRRPNPKLSEHEQSFDVEYCPDCQTLHAMNQPCPECGLTTKQAKSEKWAKFGHADTEGGQ
jgi:uncharacterized paraquat-inducible protein A